MKEKKKSINPVADRVENNTKRYSDGAENLIRDGLDALEDLFGKLLEVRPKEYKPKEFNFKPREFKPRDFKPKDFKPREFKLREFNFRKKENKKGSEEN